MALRKISLDVSWPCLNDSSQIKKPLKKKLKNVAVVGKQNDQCKPLLHSRKKNHECVTIETRSEQENRTCKNSLSSALPLKNDEFPELSEAHFKKKNSSVYQKPNSPISEKQSTSGFSQKTAFKHSLKHSKFKNGIVNIPLLSFVKVPPLKKNLPVKKINSSLRTFCGNKLDRDQPVRRKGKVRPHKKKFESRIKKEIVISKNVYKNRIVYNQRILKVKCLIPSIINSNDSLNSEKLESLLSSLRIDETQINAQSESPEIINTSLTDKDIADDSKKLLRERAKNILHSQTFREYCTNIVSSSLLKSVESFVITLRNFQDRLHAKEPNKAFAKRRYLCGFKESKKFLLVDKVKLIIIATNLQLESDLPSGRVLREIKSQAEENKIPLVFAGRGNQIGYWTLKRRRISIVSILNYEGAEELFQEVIKNWEKCKMIYNSALELIELNLSEKELSEEEISKNVEQQIRETILFKLSSEAEEKCSNDNCKFII